MPGFFVGAGRWTESARVPMCYGHITKERIMRPISGFIAAAFAVLLLAGCSSTAGDNTTYARPAETGGVRVPLN